MTLDVEVSAALAGSAAASAAVPDPEGSVAGLAWRWVVRTDALDLYATDPVASDWRATCLGAGAALHRARVALAAEGLGPGVTLLPPTGGGHLARLVTTGSVIVTPHARALYDAMESVAAGLVARGRAAWRAVTRELVTAARAEGVRLRVVQVSGELSGVLHGGDTREAWLRAGAALSAVRLTARCHGLDTAALVGAQQDGRLPRRGPRRISDREGWLTVGIGTPYARLRMRPA